MKLDVPQRKLRIALADPATEPPTFVRAHLDHLKDVVLYLWEGFPPRRAGPGKVLLHSRGKGRLKDALIGRLRGKDLHDEHLDRIARSLRKNKVDVVLAEFGYEAAEMLQACKLAKVPLVAHFHGIDAHGHEYLERYDDYSALRNGAAAVIAVSSLMAAHLVKLGFPKERVHHIPYGVDVGKFIPADRDTPPHFISVGRFVEKKAPQLLLLSFARVLEKAPEAKLTMIGDGRLWEACERMVKALRIDRNVQLAGPKDHAAIARTMPGNRAFLQHSVTSLNGDSEGTPVAVLEAMATGLPVIATRHAGIADVVTHEVNGLLCDEFDIMTMSEHILRLIADPARAKSMGMKGREKVINDHSMEIQIGKLRSVLEQAAERSN